MSDRQNAKIRIPSFRKIWRTRNSCKCSMGAKQNVSSKIFRSQGMAITGKQDRNRMRFQQSSRRNVGADSKYSSLLNSSSSEVDVFDDVVQGDVRVVARGTYERWRRKSHHGCNRILRGRKAGEYEIEPHDIW